MRIAVVTTSYPIRPGDPSGHFVQAEVRRLQREGHSITVFAPARTSADQKLDSEIGSQSMAAAREADPPPAAGDVQIVYLPHAGLFGWPGALPRLRQSPLRSVGVVPFISSLRRQLRARGPFERIIAHFIVPCGWPALLNSAPMLKGATTAAEPLELVAHGSDVRLLQRAPRFFSRRVLLDFVKMGVRLRCVSASLREDLLRLCPEVAELCTVQPCEIELGPVPSKTEARGKLGISKDEQLVIVVGRLIESKRVDVALSAAALLPRIKTVVIGDGPLLETLRQRFPEVRFVGRVDRQLSLTWMRASDLVLCASRSEGAPSVVREARALAVDVVACASGDLIDLARHDPNLYVVG